MISIVKSPSSQTFYDLIKTSSTQLLLCAPFIKKEVIKSILDLKQKDSTLSVITSANAANFVSGSSDVEAIEMLIDSGVNVINFQKLHAKIYLFDNKKALVTSANLSTNALYHNYEYGVLLDENEVDTVNEIYADFVEMMDSELRGDFNKEKLERIKEYKESFQGRRFVEIDEEEDVLLPIDDSVDLKEHFSPWENDVFECLRLIESTYFDLNDVYLFESCLKLKHPKNHHIKDKIRQILQNLCDLGFVKFVAPGKYKKLWVDL